jgi:hypothetical protein
VVTPETYSTTGSTRYIDIQPVRLFFEQYRGLEDPRGVYRQPRGRYRLTKRPLTTLALMNLLFEDKASFFSRKHPERSLENAIKDIGLSTTRSSATSRLCSRDQRAVCS